MQKSGTYEERVRNVLALQGNQALWMRVCRNVNKQMAIAHPEYPRLDDMQLMSFVKRLLPEIRALIATAR